MDYFQTREWVLFNFITILNLYVYICVDFEFLKLKLQLALASFFLSFLH